MLIYVMFILMFIEIRNNIKNINNRVIEQENAKANKHCLKSSLSHLSYLSHRSFHDITFFMKHKEAIYFLTIR